MTITPDEFDQLKTLITVVVEESVVKVIDRNSMKNLVIFLQKMNFILRL